MGVVVEPADVAQRRVERLLPGMAERRMPEVMGKAQSFGQIFVEAQRTSNGTADLRHLDAVSQPDTEMVAVGGDEYLRLVAQAAKGDRVDDAVAVALEDIARAARSGVGFRVEAATRLGRKRRNAWAKAHSVPSGTIWSDSELVQLNESMSTDFRSSAKICASDGPRNGPISSRDRPGPRAT